MSQRWLKKMLASDAIRSEIGHVPLISSGHHIPLRWGHLKIKAVVTIQKKKRQKK